MKEELCNINVTLRWILFALCLIAGSLLGGCSSDDPDPQVPCEVLELQLTGANKAILDHQSKGSNGNPEAWKSELSRLTRDRDTIQAEYTKRHCL